MNKTIIWLGGPEDEQLLPVLRQNGYTIKFLQDIKQCQELTEPLVCLIYYAPGAAIKVEDIPTGVSVVLYEPRSFTHYMPEHDIRFAKLTELARQSAAVICCDEWSSQWWSCFNEKIFLLTKGNLQKVKFVRDCRLNRIAEMIAADYLAGCDYAVRYRVGLWGKVKRYYKEFGLRQTLHRVYEKLSGQEDEN